MGLKTITHASGGRCYCPQDINEGLRLFEIETILSTNGRPKSELKLQENIDLSSLNHLPFDKSGLQVM